MRQLIINNLLNASKLQPGTSLSYSLSLHSYSLRVCSDTLSGGLRLYHRRLPPAQASSPKSTSCAPPPDKSTNGRLCRALLVTRVPPHCLHICSRRNCRCHSIPNPLCRQREHLRRLQRRLPPLLLPGPPGHPSRPVIEIHRLLRALPSVERGERSAAPVECLVRGRAALRGPVDEHDERFVLRLDEPAGDGALDEGAEGRVEVEDVEQDDG